MATAVLVRAADRMDPTWPPVLIAAVIIVVGGAAVSVFMVFRSLRAAAREGRRQSSRGEA
jgi:hypothetical protein